MKTKTVSALFLLLSFSGAGCAVAADEAPSEHVESQAQALVIPSIPAINLPWFTLATCNDPSGFCVSAVGTSPLPPRGRFDADGRGLYFVSYRPEAVDYYTAVALGWDGAVKSQSTLLPGRPQIENPAIVGDVFVFGEGRRNAVMDVTGKTPAFLTSATPYPKWPDMTPNGGVVLGDGRYLSTTEWGGSALGVSGGLFTYPIECGATDAHRCQRRAPDRTPSAGGFIVAGARSIQRVRVPEGGGAALTFGLCASAQEIDGDAPLASASDVAGAPALHAAFRLQSGALVDCRETAPHQATLRTVALPDQARDYDFDPSGGLWITMKDQWRIAYRSKDGALTYAALPAEPTYLKVLGPTSVVVLTSGGRFYRITRRA